VPTARRQFFGNAARAGLTALAAPVLATAFGEAYGGDMRAYAGTQYALELDGAFAGFVWNPSGGNVVAEVISEKMGPDRIQRKRIGARRIEPITIETSLPIARPFYEWIKSSVDARLKFMRKNGAIIAFDFDGKERSRRNFSNAFVSAVQFPACDASSKEAARLTVTFAPEVVALTAGKGTLPPQPVRSQKGWLHSAFRLRIKGLEPATDRVNKIEPITIKVTTPPAGLGEKRDSEFAPATIDVGNLVINVPEAVLAPVYAWHEDFVVKGNSGPERERVGVLEYLHPDMKSPLLVLNLFNLGIFRIAPEPVAPNVERLAQSKVEMYCQAITADFSV
jgi:hypothetical protein